MGGELLDFLMDFLPAFSCFCGSCQRVARFSSIEESQLLEKHYHAFGFLARGSPIAPIPRIAPAIVRSWMLTNARRVVLCL